MPASRTTAFKGLYFGMMFGAAASYWVAAFYFHLPMIAMVLLIPAFFIPGRILGFFWRDLLRGSHLLNQKRYAESKIQIARFLDEFSRRPWIRWFIFLGSSTHSRNPWSLALNNLAAAEIGLGEFPAARRHLEESMAADAKNPLPYHNMSMLLTRTGARDEAAEWLAKAKALGWGNKASDRIVRASQRRFAARYATSEKNELNPASPMVMNGRFRVELINDDTTPMELVVEVLQLVFGRDYAQAVIIMLETHRNGRGVCGFYELEEAEAKIKAVNRLVAERGFELRCAIAMAQ